MKRRGAARVLGIDFDDDYLAQARFAAEVTGHDIEFRKLSVYDVGGARRALRRRALHGRALPPAPPAAGARPDPRARGRGPARLPVDAARVEGGRAGRGRTTPSGETEHFDEPGYPKMHFIEHRYADDPTNWWAPNRACVGGDAAQRRLRDRRSIPRTRSTSAAASSAPVRAPAPSIRRRGGRDRADDRSGDDLERAEQQVPLGPGARSGLEPVRRDGDRGRPGDQGREPDLPRVLGGMSPIDPLFIQQPGGPRRARPRRRGRRARLPARLEPLADPRMAGEDRRDPRRHRQAGLGHARSASPPSAPRRCRPGA